MTPFRRAARAAAAASLLLGAISFLTPAHATTTTITPNCGDTVGAGAAPGDVFELGANVGPCQFDGLIIGASGITLDLKGHRIFGTSGPMSTANGDFGVGVRVESKSGVTVTSTFAGGQIDHFDGGVRIDGSLGVAAANNTVSNLTLRDNFSESLTGGDDGEGVSIIGPLADDNTVENNQIINNGPFAGVSVYLGNSGDKITGTVIDDNTILDNRSQSSQTSGIRIENWTWNSTISGNTVSGSSLDGIQLFARVENTLVSGNTVTDNGVSGDSSHRPGHGIVVFNLSRFNTIEDNSVTGNGGHGIALQGPLQLTPVSPSTAGATDNTVQNNVSLNNSTDPIVFVEGPPVTVSVSASARVAGSAGGTPVSISTVDTYDLYDGNSLPPCDNNTWTGNNASATRNQSCIS